MIYTADSRCVSLLFEFKCRTNGRDQKDVPENAWLVWLVDQNKEVHTVFFPFRSICKSQVSIRSNHLVTHSEELPVSTSVFQMKCWWCNTHPKPEPMQRTIQVMSFNAASTCYTSSIGSRQSSFPLLLIWKNRKCTLLYQVPDSKPPCVYMYNLYQEIWPVMIKRWMFTCSGTPGSLVIWQLPFKRYTTTSSWYVEWPIEVCWGPAASASRPAHILQIYSHLPISFLIQWFTVSASVNIGWVSISFCHLLIKTCN